MKQNTFGFWVFYCITTICCRAVHAAPLSQYGQIQNVQNYSTNPFWSPGQQYNKRILPTPVYATGPEVTTSDCQNIVTGLISAQCASLNNCSGMRVSDVRPAIMLELSRMPGHNYASSCAGYIDTAFDTYVKQYANAVQPTSFPTATGAANVQTQNEFKINNPYAPKVPGWANDVKERAIELQQLQSQNGAGAEHIAKADFPTTINDVSFTDRMENLAAGYAPYKDAKAYNGITVEKPEDALQRQVAILQQQRAIDEITMSRIAYCDKYPLDDKICPQAPGLEEQVIAIGNAPSQSPQSNPANNTPDSHTPEIVNEINIHIAPVTNSNNTQNAQPPSVPTVNGPTVNIAKNDNTTRGGPCTPSAKSKWFPNKILTSGKYETIDPAFEKAMVQFFRMEGECGNHTADKGGYTCYGFAQRYNPDIDVSKLTRPAAEDRTYDKIYQANGIDRLPDSVRGDVLRGWFGSGYYGVQQMQKVLGLPLTKTGRVDDAMVSAAMNYTGDLHQAYWDQMQQYYVNITKRNPSQKVFLKGWMNSVKLMRENGCHVEPDQPLTR
ncbi:MAG: hypothetical protein K2I81_01790 [Alphaproteobacteria bacterium]|nr:hypothetical protein [Alphaproteobacteria bacterium]